MFKIRNKHTAPCKTCGSSVDVGCGWSSKDSYGRWFSVCDTARCAEAQGLSGVGVPAKRSLRESPNGERLVIEMPYEKDAIILLRSLPGSRWDGQSKTWTCSATTADRRRVLEIADKLKLQVPESLRVLSDPRADEIRQRCSGTPVYPYQVDGAEFLGLHEKALLADDCGLGKSLEVLMALPADAQVLVICPNTVRRVWSAECRKWRPDLEPVLPMAAKDFAFPKAGEVVIVNYEKAPSKVEGFSGYLVVDEAHYVKNYKAARSKRVTALAKVASHTWLLTGTPLANKPFDLWGVLSSGSMAFDVFGRFNRFIQLFGGHKNRWGGYEFASKADPEAAERLRRVMIRRRKDDVLEDLPAKRRQDIEVNGISASLRKQCDDAYNAVQELLLCGVMPSFEDFSAVRAALAQAKLAAAIELIESYEDAGEPVVVFSAHRAPVEALGARDGWAQITGGMDTSSRAQAVEDFQAGKLKGIALTIGAGAEGITLTRASRMLFVDLDWVPGKNLQAEDRIRRIGQKAAALEYIRLVVAHPLDQHCANLLTAKMNLIESAIDAEAEYTAPEPPSVRPAALTDEEWAARVEAHNARQEAAEEARTAARTVVERREHETAVERILEQEITRQEEENNDLERLGDTEFRARLIAAHHNMIAHCDGAIKDDGVGFNKPDAPRARILMQYDLDTPVAARALWLLLLRYRSQLCDRGFGDLFAQN